MANFLGKMGILSLLIWCSACSKAPDTQDQDKEQAELQAQESEQGYPVLVAMPQSAHYALPFCEKKYCIEVEIFDFKSKDQWFNQYTDAKIADLIRQQLGISQKLSLQRAVNEFVSRSDAWQEENEQKKAWTMYIKPRLAMQQGVMALLQVHTEYHLGDEDVPPQDYFYVADRKAQQTVRLYDIVKQKSRVPFMNFIQEQYAKWQESLTEQQRQELPEKIYWANQDWFFDDQGIAIYYRAHDLAVEGRAKDLTIYLSPEQMKQWILPKYLKQLQLL